MRLERLTYSVEEAAVLLGISRGKAYESIRSGRLKATRLGRRFVVSANALEALLGEGEAPAGAADVLNQVAIVGHLTRAPEERPTRSGNRMMTLRMAIHGPDPERRVFIDVVVFGDLVDDVVGLTKAQRVCVAGRLDQREWTSEDGHHRTIHQIVARRVEALEPGRHAAAS